MSDPKLKAAMKDIERICEKYDCAAVVSLTSKTHGEFRYILRDWLGVRLLKEGTDGAHRWHVKVHAKSNNEEAQLTCHWLYSTLDVLGNFFLSLERVRKMIDERMKVDHEPFHGFEPHTED